MAFAQLTFRESLRDIETCLSAQASKRYHMGFRNPVRRSTLVDANETRDWRIYAEFAQRLIAQARRLYAGDSLGVDLDVNVLDLLLPEPGAIHVMRLNLNAPLYTLLQILSLTLFEKMPILHALSQDNPRTETVDDANQSTLFAS
jgi:hypothetical protein